MKRKSALGKFNIFLSVVLVICIIATAYAISAYPKIVEIEDASTADAGDVSTLEASFTAGTYGGKEFATIDDVVKYYVECYNYTKTLTASYKEEGEAKTYYKLLGDEYLNVENVLVEGKSNSLIDGLVPTIVGGIFKGSVKGLSPSDNRDPLYDTRNDGALDLRTSALTTEDVLDANVVENSDGTISITIQPKAVVLSMPGEDAQGRFFNVLGDISSTVNSIDVLSFSEGTIDENFVVDYKGGTGTVKIDTKTGEIVEADFKMLVHIDVKHANVAVLKNKKASLDIVYTNHFPASDDYLMKSRTITRG
ncbi:MAG: hypothetical protein J1E81_07300 [Eubacterium sp.]|nr:hypothetical protein [Eubacterium sp.]